MNNILSIVLFAITFSAALAATTKKHNHHPAEKCIIAPAATTNCSGITGPNCRNQTTLMALVKSNQPSVLVCTGKSDVPKSKNVTLALSHKSCKNCVCFLVPANEKRSCTALNSDTTFIKKSCTDQASLLSFLAVSAKVEICIGAKKGNTLLQKEAKIYARLYWMDWFNFEFILLNFFKLCSYIANKYFNLVWPDFTFIEDFFCRNHSTGYVLVYIFHA